MTEPASTAIAAGASGVMVFGIATGLPADLIFPAFVGALWALRSVEEGGPWARALQVFVGTYLAAVSTQPVTLWAADIIPGVKQIPAEMMRYPVAWLIGWGGLSIALRRIGLLVGGEK